MQRLFLTPFYTSKRKPQTTFYVNSIGRLHQTLFLMLLPHIIAKTINTSEANLTC